MSLVVSKFFISFIKEFSDSNKLNYNDVMRIFLDMPKAQTVNLLANVYGNYEHIPTGFVLNKLKKVYGKQVKDMVQPLNDKDRLLLQEYGFEEVDREVRNLEPEIPDGEEVADIGDIEESDR